MRREQEKSNTIYSALIEAKGGSRAHLAHLLLTTVEITVPRRLYGLDEYLASWKHNACRCSGRHCNISHDMVSYAFQLMSWSTYNLAGPEVLATIFLVCTRIYVKVLPSNSNLAAEARLYSGCEIGALI
jgi:hypothetical protein